jgi:hypothetical protein
MVATATPAEDKPQTNSMYSKRLRIINAARSPWRKPKPACAKLDTRSMRVINCRYVSVREDSVMAALWGVRNDEARMPSAIKIDLDAPFLMEVCILGI